MSVLLHYVTDEEAESVQKECGFIPVDEYPLLRSRMDPLPGEVGHFRQLVLHGHRGSVEVTDRVFMKSAMVSP